MVTRVERWLHGEERLLLLQIQGHYQHQHGGSHLPGTPGLAESDMLFWTLYGRCMHAIHRYLCRQTPMCKIKINTFKKVTSNG